MNADFDLVYNILLARVDIHLLKDLWNVLLHEDKTKFYAFTYVKIDKDNFSNAHYFLQEFQSFRSYGGDDRTRKPLPDNGWTSKGIDELVEEGVYTHYGIQFIGLFFDNDWYVISDLRYFADTIDEATAKKITLFHGRDIQWDSPFFDSMDSPTNNIFDFDIQIEEQAFASLPRLVATIKLEKKQSLNRAFRLYITEEVFGPLFQKLKISDPYSYQSTTALLMEKFVLIFPEHKRYVLAAIAVNDVEYNVRLEYFVYEQHNQKTYRWTYLKENKTISEFDVAEEVIATLSEISDWNHERFLNNSRTLDDVNFWNDYVFKKNGDDFIFLEEIKL